MNGLDEKLNNWKLVISHSLCDGIANQRHDFRSHTIGNRHPSVQCDIEAYIFMALLEELDYVATARVQLQTKLLTDIQKIAKHFDLNMVTSLRKQNDGRRQWRGQNIIQEHSQPPGQY